MKCRICNNQTALLFQHLVLNRYRVNYHRCENCGFVCTEDPYWLSEAYSRPINYCDTGIIARNEQLRDALLFLFIRHFKRNARFLDYAGGYGLLTRMMRDCGFDFYWDDPYTENIFAQGFQSHREHIPYDAITCCECFEHFVDPIFEVSKMLKLSSNIFFTTSLISFTPPAPNQWDYYGFAHGQHVSFYTEKSLKILAEQLGLTFRSSGRSLHFLGDRPPKALTLKLSCSAPIRLSHLLLGKLNGTRIFKDHEKMKDFEGHQS